MVAIAPGMFLAHRVVPSSGSTAISTLGPPFRLPTFSPMNSIGASSRSPSPMTTVPSIASLSSSRRMPSTAAWSASFPLPRPRSRAAATAARSVTRTISIDTMRSSMVVDFAAAAFWLDAMSLGSLFCSGRRQIRSILLDADHLRRTRNDTLFPDRLQGAPHRVLAGRVGDQDDRRRRIRALRIVAAMRPATVVPLHDRFKRYVLAGQELGDRRKGAGTVDRREADIIPAFVTLHRRPLDGGETRARAAERRGAHPARDVADVGDHRRGGRVPAGARADQGDGRKAFGVDRD